MFPFCSNHVVRKLGNSLLPADFTGVISIQNLKLVVYIVIIVAYECADRLELRCEIVFERLPQ